MYRYKHKRRLKKQASQALGYIRKNMLSLFLIAWIVAGVFLGNTVFRMLTEEQLSTVSQWLVSVKVPINFVQGCSAVLRAAFGHLLILVLLFLFGLTAYGCPLIVGILLLYGFRIGVLECQSYATVGWLMMLICVHFPMIIASVAVIMGAKQSMDMTCIYSRQLLPSGAHCGGLWLEFKRYLIRYHVCVWIVISSAITEVLMGIFCSQM